MSQTTSMILVFPSSLLMNPRMYAFISSKLSTRSLSLSMITTALRLPQIFLIRGNRSITSVILSCSPLNFERARLISSRLSERRPSVPVM